MSRRAEVIYRNAVVELRREMAGIYRALLRELRSEGCTPGVPGDDFRAAVELLDTALDHRLGKLFQGWLARKSNYEPLFSIPPARRARPAKPAAKPVTLIERRAVAVHKKVKEWQRKQKLAATKIKQYRRKVEYYRKKGVVT
jgi:hypothetical protein